MVCVVSPFGDHTFPDAELEVRTIVSPSHTVVGPSATMVGVGIGTIVTPVIFDVPEHPFPLSTVTL